MIKKESQHAKEMFTISAIQDFVQQKYHNMKNSS